MSENYDQENTTTIPEFWGVQTRERWYFPGQNLQYMEIEVMNEGKKARFQKMTSRDLTLDRNSGNAKVRIDPAIDRHELIKASVVDWNIYRGGKPYQYSARALTEWLELADPKLVEDLEKFIRKLNPWLVGDTTVEDIDQQIEELEEMKREILAREAGEGDFANR